MNLDSPSHLSINENNLPLLTQIKEASFPSKTQSDNYYSTTLRSEIRSFLTSSILQKHAESDFLKLNWAYNKLLQMRFYRPNILEMFRKLEGFDANQFSKETLLNYFIDLYHKEFTGIPSASEIFQTPPIGDSFSQFRRKPNSMPKSVFVEEKSLFQEINQCPICLSEFSISSIKITLQSCFHSFCEVCLLDYLKFEISSGKVQAIRCPVEKCLTPLEESEISEILAPRAQSILVKYKKFKVDLEVLSNPLKKWCIRPNCNTWLMKEENNQINRMVCPTCNQEFCFHCNNPWHGDKSCEEVIDEEYLKYEAEVVVKHCPKCGWKIEKNEGCNHMHCRCGHHFCWVCLSNYENGYCVNNCPKFPNNAQHNNELALQMIAMDDLEWELRMMRFNESRWSWFDLDGPFGKLKYFIAFIISFISFPIILILIFYVTILFGIICEPFRKIYRIIRGIDEYPIEVEFRCNNFENACYLFVFIPFFVFMNMVLLIFYLLLQLFYYIEKHIYTNFLKYFVILEKTNNVFAVFCHLKVMANRNKPSFNGNNENVDAEMRIVTMLSAVSFFFIMSMHFFVAMIIIKYTV